MALPPHGDVTTAANLHRIGVVSDSDPGAIGAWKIWTEVDGSDTWVATHERDEDDAGWHTLASAAGATPAAHAASHEDGGSDEISLTGLTGAPALASATTAVTQTAADNSTKVATTAYADAAAAAAAGTYTNENAQDAVGAMVDASLNYVDGTPLLQRAALTGDTTAAAGSNATTHKANLKVASIPFVIDGGGTAITTGIKGDIVVDFDGTITGWTLLADQSGSITIDTWKDTYANFPPLVADTMWGTKPALSGAAKNQATGLSIAVTAGDIIRFNVDSAATVTRVTLSFTITKS